MNLFLKSMKRGSGASESKTMPKQSRDKVDQPQCHQICQGFKNQQIKICSEKNTRAEPYAIVIIKVKIRQEIHTRPHAYTNTQHAHAHTLLLDAQRNASLDFVKLGGDTLTLCEGKCGYMLFISMTGNDKKALFYYEGVNNKTRGSLIPFCPRKCWGIKLQKMPGLNITSGEQKLKETWARKVKNLRICCKCEVNGRIHQEPTKTASLPGQFRSLGVARISQTILTRGNASFCRIWFVSKCCFGFFFFMNIAL